MNFRVEIKNKEASTVAGCIVCGNSDYTITFAFDSEWAELTYKTARFVYTNGDKLEYKDVVFKGNTVEVPEFRNVDEVYVGVYSGDLHTTTPARIVCKRSILCGDAGIPEPASPDVYAQIIELINSLVVGEGGLPAVSADDKGKMLAVDVNGAWNKQAPKDLGLVDTETLELQLTEHGLPEVSEDDKGKMLAVDENGKWSPTDNYIPAKGERVSSHLYGAIVRGIDGTAMEVGVSEMADPSTIVLRTSTGQVETKDPTVYEHAVSLGYLQSLAEEWTFTLEDGTTVTKKVLVLPESALAEA